jgi:ketose-bisphosphate aldolase
MKTTLKQELEKAYQGGYAIPAFNFDNYEIARGIINAELVKAACANGFTSVMLDASKESMEDNIRMTQEVVACAKKYGVDVESEIGHVGGKEDDRDSKGNGYTTVAEAKEFEDATKIDALAIAVGTAHGVYKTEPKLQFELIKDIKANTTTPLVLHGSSGVKAK